MAENSSSNWRRIDPRVQLCPKIVYRPASAYFLSPTPQLPHPHLPQPWTQFFLSGRGEDRPINMENLERDKYLNRVSGNNEEFFLPINEFHQEGSHEDSLSLTNKSCITSLNGAILNFSDNRMDARNHLHHLDQQSSPESNTSRNGGILKKARVTSSTQPPFKVRKEKLGDRITTLHQLVSPFGKTDTASVLLEAIGYIRFLQSQIEALSSPYLPTTRSQHNDAEERAKDLRSRGLCLVPVSCTYQVGSGIYGGAY